MPSSPRISVNDLALFMVSSTTAQIGIVRRAKSPQTPPIIRYKDARGPICEYLSDNSRNQNPLILAEQMFQQRVVDPSLSTLLTDDAEKSIEVIHAIIGMGNQLAGYDFVKSPEKQNKLTVSGVTVSVKADLLVRGHTKILEQIGAAVLRMTQDDKSTPAAIQKRKDMGLYVATLAKMHVDQNIQSNRQTANRLCMSIDVQHGEIFVAPNANARRINDLTSACQMISLLWPTV